MRDTQKIKIIMKLFKEEFDLKLYQKEGIISKYFPVHHYKDRSIMTQYWWKQKFKIHFKDLFT